MALNLAQRDVLSTNGDFLSRVRSAVGKQAQYYLDLAGSATQAQQDWAANVFWAGKRLAQVAADCAPQVVQHALIYDGTDLPDASDVSDDDVQAAVAACCDRYS